MSRARVLTMGAGLVAAAVVAWASGLSQWLTPQALQELLAQAGPWGAVWFVGLFAAGTLFSVPGVVFIAAALLVWGPVHGGLLALVGGVVSAATQLCVLRRVGGRAEPGTGPTMRPVAWALGQLEARPVTATATLRALTVLAPPVNIALALSPLRARDHLVGTAAGLLVPITVYAVFFDCLFA
jgi:uncharacterized membrane protein YdjX (TVP38/TMEM64 family)